MTETKSVTPNQPKVDRPVFPQGYGIPETEQDFLPWSHVEERLSGAKNYWVGTVHPEGRPQATPVWGVWLNGTLYIEGSRETRRARNMLHNPAVVVHLESGDDVIILEGTAHEIPNPDHTLGTELSQAYTSKYSSMGYAPEPDNWDGGGLFAVQPNVVLAWTQFPKDTTQFTFSK